MATTYRIHPAIGIARVGDSTDEFFVGPEAPGVPAVLAPPGGASNGTYKDAAGHIKRQGARFRVYEYTEDRAGVVTAVREITAAEAEIEWEVHLANRKAAAPRFKGGGRRNPLVPESKLIIDAGRRRIAGANQPMTPLSGSFMTSMTVRLGDLLTDDGGRLIVLGGKGESQSLSGQKDDNLDFVDNDGWCDDISDGPIRARVRLAGNVEAIEADSAWVIVAPPDFAPPIENVITLYDVVYNMMATFDPALAVGDATPVSFTRDIYPILRRVSNLHWVSAVAADAHGEGRPNHFLAPEVLELLASKAADAVGLRGRIFRALRDPQGRGDGTMPKLPDDLDPKTPGVSLTPVQYRRMDRWSAGTFEADWPGSEPKPLPLDMLPVAERPHALDRAALEACAGGGFFPGIEVGRVMTDPATYDPGRPFRVSVKDAGTLTARMAVPWQADFHDCSIQDGADWWPAQRPNQVRRVHAEWMPRKWTHRDMVEQWSKLGFVTEKKLGTTTEYLEEERAPDLDDDS
jgi:hypothetical protein